MNDDLTKRDKRRLRELAALAHERHLGRELQPLTDAIDRFRRGELSSFVVAQAVHLFDNGPAKRLFSQYNHSDTTAVVASAIVNGILSQAEVDVNVPRLETLIDFFRERLTPEEPT